MVHFPWLLSFRPALYPYETRLGFEGQPTVSPMPPVVVVLGMAGFSRPVPLPCSVPRIASSPPLVSLRPQNRRIRQSEEKGTHRSDLRFSLKVKVVDAPVQIGVGPRPALGW